MFRGDIREARRGMKFVTGPDGSRVMDGAFIDDLTGRIIRIMFVNWSWGPPTLKDATTEDLAQRMLDQKLTDDDARALEMAVGPWVERVLSTTRPTTTFVHVATGGKFDVSDPDEAAKLAASADFTVLESADPKNGRKAIGTSSSESPEPNGQIPTE